MNFGSPENLNSASEVVLRAEYGGKRVTNRYAEFKFSGDSLTTLRVDGDSSHFDLSTNEILEPMEISWRGSARLGKPYREWGIFLIEDSTLRICCTHIGKRPDTFVTIASSLWGR